MLWHLISKKLTQLMLFTLAIARVLQSSTGLFSVANFVHNFGTLVHNEFKFCSVFCTLGLVVSNTPETAKVLDSILNRTIFF